MKAMFRIEFGHWTSNRTESPYGVSLCIEDDASGEMLARVSLDPEQFTAMMRGGVLSGIEGTRSPYLDRVGKRMENTSFPVPREVSGYGRSAEDETAVREWAAAQPWASDWETLEMRATNAGWVVIGRRWVADPATEATP